MTIHFGWMSIVWILAGIGFGIVAYLAVGFLVLIIVTRRGK